jgi:alpha-beta hydrolase superfamily lysophospholipase
MKKATKNLILIIVFITICAGGARILFSHKIDCSLVYSHPEKASIADSLPFQNINIDLSDRMLHANFLSAGQNAESIFVCIGSGEALYEWSELQLFLYKKGYSSFVFTYTGFGNSTGKPTVKILNEDVVEAYAKYVMLTPKSPQRIILTHSLGAGPLLQVANKLKPSPSKLILNAPFSSVKDLAIDLGQLPKSLKWLAPDIWNNMKNAKKSNLPIYLIHSKADSVSFTHSKRIANYSGDNAQLLLLDGFDHNTIYQNISDSFFDPIMEFALKEEITKKIN